MRIRLRCWGRWAILVRTVPGAPVFYWTPALTHEMHESWSYRCDETRWVTSIQLDIRLSWGRLQLVILSPLLEKGEAQPTTIG